MISRHPVTMLISTATPNKQTVLCREMDQRKGSVRNTEAFASQLDPANRFKSPTRDVKFLRSDSNCQRNVGCPILLYNEISGFSTKRQGLSIDRDIKLTSYLLIVKMEGCRHIFCFTEFKLSFAKARG